MTIAELIKALSAFDSNDEVNLTFEGMVPCIDGIYKTPKHGVLLDGDDCAYKKQFTEGRR